ncbi:CBS domain-containing protein [Paucibacter sediminis]|uniref:CBS domain-containing protein n=1 Tax=Paucibacter sediminis TaxID=3019553 RepID=A0AA95NM29_9BURK|nr:CBS domain-containing protein [Paucibacter sp. S2-9]WIT13786.1 CBS domain-containing protein [Paucibacter sp. S2-9]
MTRMHDLMSSNLVTVELDDSLATVKEIFDSSSFHHLLVVEEGRLFGVVSDRDLLRAISPYVGTMVETTRDLATLNKRVHQVMSRKPLTLRPEDPVGDAIRLFLEHGISCLPIVVEDLKPVGIVTWRDVLRALAPR